MKRFVFLAIWILEILLFVQGGSVFADNRGKNAADDCVTIRTVSEGQYERNVVFFKNNCSEDIFVFWCGNLRYSNKKCGDASSGRYYTQLHYRVKPGEEAQATFKQPSGVYSWGACYGTDPTGGDFVTDKPDGSYICLPTGKYKSE